MEMARAQDPRSPRLPEEGNTKTKLQDEPKTAEKDNSEAPFDMKNLEKVQQKISYEEIFARQKKAKAERNKNFQQKIQQSIISTAFYRFVNNLHPTIALSSAQYLFKIAQISKISFSKKLFRFTEIKSHFEQIYYEGFTKFYGNSIKILNARILELVDILKPPSNAIDTKIEIMSFCLMKNEIYQQPFKHINKKTYFSLTKLAKKLELHKHIITRLKTIYKQSKHNLDYFVLNTEFSQLFDAYYLLSIKNDILLQQMAKVKEERIQYYYDLMEKAKLQMNIEVSQKDNDEKGFMSIKYADYVQKLPTRVKIKAQPEEIIDAIEIFEEIIRKNMQLSQKTALIKKLNQKHQSQKSYYQQFQRYKIAKEKYQKKYGSDLSVYKLNLMAYHLKNNPAYTYEQVMKKSFYGKHLYIQRQFFQENIVRVLRKETQYYQMAYLDKVMQGIEEGRGKGSPIIFVDYFDAGCEQDRMRDQTEKLPPEASLVSAVGFDGLFLCRMYHKKMSIPFFLKEVAQMLQGQSEGGTLVFFDRDFPSSWLKREEVFKLRVNNVLLNVPFIEAIPNPSSRVCKIVWSSVQQRLRAGFQDQAAAFQKAVIARKGSNIKGLVDKEWEKSKKFNLSIEAKRLLSSELPREDNKPEGQGSVKMKAEQAGLKTVRGKRKTVKRQSADVEESDSEAELMDDERQMSDVEQFPSESGSNQASPAPNPSDHPLPHMENIHNMNEEILRKSLSILINECKQRYCYSFQATSFFQYCLQK